MLNNMATRSKVLLGFFFVILLTGLGFYGCGTNSSSTLDLPSNSTTAAAIPVSLSAPPLIPVPVVPPTTAITGITAASAGQVTISAPNTLANGDIVAISGSTNYNGTYIAIDPTPPSFTIAAPFVGPLVPSGTTPPVFQPQILATPVTGIAPSTTTPGQVTIVANNTLTEGTPIVITGSSITDLNGPTTAIAPTPATFSITTTYVPPPVPPAGTSTTLPAGTTLGVILTGGGVLPETQCKTNGTAAITLPRSAVAPAGLDMDNVPSRFTGVAPLAVFFDATGTTATKTSKPFHELEYRWNFGDDETVLWANGAHVGDGSVLAKKNRAAGPMGAHVFEKPGTYIVNLTVNDGTNTVSNGCVQIAVSDPDVVFAGANTVCIANSTATAGSGGCPAGAATPAGTASFNTALAACIGTTKRCLFNRGDTFTSSAVGVINVAGPLTIGAYGTGALPRIQSTKISGVIAPGAGASDLRVMDLNITGSGSSDTGIAVSISGNPSNLTILRLSSIGDGTTTSIRSGVIVQSGANITGSVIQDSTFYNLGGASGGGYAYFGWMRNSAMLGNSFGPLTAQAQHVVRLEPGQRVAISNNSLTTPGAAGVTVLTIRANEHTVPCTGSGCVNTYPAGTPLADTQYIYVSDNVINGGTTSAQLFQVGPASTSQNDWIYDVVAERNWLIFGSAGLQGYFTQSARVTYRNNLCDSSGAPGAQYCFSNDYTNAQGSQTPDNDVFLNNTCYSSKSTSNQFCVTLGYSGAAMTGTVTNSVVENNLAYAPNAASPKLLFVPTPGNVINSTGASGTYGNSSDVQAKTLADRPWASGTPVNPIDFKPNIGSYAIGGCSVNTPCPVVPIWSDFFLTTEPAPRDMGAVNH